MIRDTTLLPKLLSGKTIKCLSMIDWTVYDGGGSVNFVRVNLPKPNFEGADTKILFTEVEVTIRLSKGKTVKS